MSFHPGLGLMQDRITDTICFTVVIKLSKLVITDIYIYIYRLHWPLVTAWGAIEVGKLCLGNGMFSEGNYLKQFCLIIKWFLLHSPENICQNTPTPHHFHMCSIFDLHCKYMAMHNMCLTLNSILKSNLNSQIINLYSQAVEMFKNGI